MDMQNLQLSNSWLEDFESFQSLNFAPPVEYLQPQYHTNLFLVRHWPVSTNEAPVSAPLPERRRRAYRHIVPAPKQKRVSDVEPQIKSNPKRHQGGKRSKKLGKEESQIFWNQNIDHPCVSEREKLVIELRWMKGLDWQSVTDTFNQIMREKVGNDQWVDVPKPALQMRENRLAKKILKHEKMCKKSVAENAVLPQQVGSPVDLGVGRVAAGFSIERFGAANSTNIERVPLSVLRVFGTWRPISVISLLDFIVHKVCSIRVGHLTC